MTIEKRLKTRLALSTFAFGTALLGGAYAVSAAESQPAYEASIKVGNENDGERGEAAALASLAKIDSAQATKAAVEQSPGSVLKVSLDNENGNLVYSVEIKTARNEIKDVKVDAGNGKVLSVDAGDDENGAEREGDDEKD